MHLKELGNITTAANTIDALFKQGETGNLKLAETLKGLSDKEKIAVVSRTNLSRVQKIGVLTTSKVDKAMLQTAATTGVLSEAEEIATSSTRGLTAVFKGLWTTLKANPLLIVASIIGTIVSLVSAWNQHQENLRQSTLEDANTFKEASSSISDYTERYKELHQQLLDARGNEEETYNVKQQLLELQKEINEKFGEEYEKINLVTDAYKDQTEAIKNYNTEAAKTFFNSSDNQKEFKKASKKMSSFGANLSSGDLQSGSDKGKAVQEVANSFANKGVKVVDDGDGRFFVRIETDSVEDAYNTISEFEQALRDKAEKLGNEHLFDDVLKISGQAYDDAKNTIDKWGEIYQQGLMAKIAQSDTLSDGMNDLTQSVQDYNDAVLKSEDPFNDDDVEAKRKALADLVSSMKDENGEWNDQWKEFGTILDSVLDEADTKLVDFDQKLKNDTSLQDLASKMKGMSREVIEGMADDGDNGDVFDKFKKAAKDAGLSVDELIDTLVRLGYVQDSIADKVEENTTKTKREMINTINSMSDGFDVLDKIYTDVYDGGSFDFTNLDTSKFSEAFKGLETEYEDFIETVSSNPSNITACQQAFDNLTDAYITQKGILTDVTSETANLTVQMLENMGVANAKEVVNGALEVSEANVAAQKILSANASFDLANAAEGEITALIDEAGQSQVTAQAIFYLLLQKQMANANPLDSSRSISNLIALATNAGVTGDVIANLTKLLSIYNQIQNATAAGQYGLVESLKAQAETLVATIKKQASSFQTTVRPIAKYSGASDTAAAKQKKLSNAASEANKALKEQKEALEKQKEALENSKEALEDQKQEYEDLYDAISWFYDKEIDKIDEKIDALNDANDALQDQLDTYDGILSVVENVYQAEIDAIQAKIDALDDANDAKEKELALEEAQRKLEEARSRKNIYQYTADRGYVYTVDDKAIKEASDEVDTANADKIKAELQEQIDLLDKMKEKWSEIPDAFEKAMNEIKAIQMWGPNYKDFILNSGDIDIEAFKKQYTNNQQQQQDNEDQISVYEKQKEEIEKLKDLWEDAKNAYRDSQYEAKLSSFFGSDYEYQLLENSAGWRQKFANEYGEICKQIEDYEKQIKEIEKQISELEEKAKEVGSGSGSGSGGAGGGGNPDGGIVKKYIWDEKRDGGALASAQHQLAVLNAIVGKETSGAAYEAQQKLQKFVSEFENLKDSKVVTEDFSQSLEDLKNSENSYLSGIQPVLDGVTDRLSTAEKFTDGIAYYTSASANSFSNLQGAAESIVPSLNNAASSSDTFKNNAEAVFESAGGTADKVAQSADTATKSVGNLIPVIENTTQKAAEFGDVSESSASKFSTSMDGAQKGVHLLSDKIDDTKNKGAELGTVTSGALNAFASTASGIANGVHQTAQVVANDMRMVTETMDGVTAGQADVEQTGDQAITDTIATLEDVTQKVSDLNAQLDLIATHQAEVKQTADTAVTETDQVITDTQAKLEGIDGVISTLKGAITDLEYAMHNLLDIMSSLDERTFTKVSAAIGFGSGYREDSLYGAVISVIDMIGSSDNEESLLGKLALVDNTSLEQIQNQFSGDDVSLLMSVQKVIDRISNDAEAPCLITTINRIAETIPNIQNVTNGFITLHKNIYDCVNRVNDLQEAINNLKDKTITITVNTAGSGVKYLGSAYGSGTAHFATGTAVQSPISTGKSFANGTGKWALPKPEPNSLVGELGYEILLRDGQYHIIKQPQFLDLKRGDIIFNHEQSKAILDGGKQSTIERLDKKANKVIGGLSKLSGLSFLNGTGAIFDEKLYLASMQAMASNPGKVYDDFSKAAMVSAAPTKNNVPKDIVTNNNQQTSNVYNINGDLSFPNITNGDDAKKLIESIKRLPLDARQFAGRRR